VLRYFCTLEREWATEEAEEEGRKSPKRKRQGGSGEMVVVPGMGSSMERRLQG
jgi:hypothetical protein